MTVSIQGAPIRIEVKAPQGPAGSNGSQGPAGPAGPQGPAGTTSWNGITDKPSTFTPSAHTHGNITNSGTIGTTANLVVTTTTGGALTVISRLGIDSRTSFPNGDITNATSGAAANSIVRRDGIGGAGFGFLSCSTLNSSGDVQFVGNLVFSGIFSTTFTEAATANRTIIVPDASGTIALASTQAQTFLNALPASIPSAILNLDSSTQALKIPSMTEAQRNAIASPVAGLILYNTTTNRPNFHNGTSWVAL